MNQLSGLLRRAVLRLLRDLPPASREYGEGLLSEAEHVDGTWARLRWLLGGLRFAAGERRVLRSAIYAAALAACAAGLTVLNARADADMGGQYAMAFLLASAGALGAAAPSRAWIPGIVLGVTLAAGGLIALALGAPPAPDMHPPGVAGEASLLALIAPAMVAAYAGAWVRALTLARRS